MIRLHKTAQRAAALALAVSMAVSCLPTAIAVQDVNAATPIAQTEEPHDHEPDQLDTEGIPVVLPEVPAEEEGEPVTQPLDPEEDGAVILPEVPADEEPTDFPVVLPTLPGEEPDIPSEGGTTVITWPDPNDGESSTEPGTDEDTGVDTGDVVDDPANIPVILPSFPDEEPDGGKTDGVCADLITEVEDTGTTVITWPEPNDADVEAQALPSWVEKALEVAFKEAIKTWVCNHESWNETKRIDATCTSDGVIYYKCAGEDVTVTVGKYSGTFHCDCTKTKTETIQAYGHDWDNDTVKITYKYDCKEGTQVGYCNRCKTTITIPLSARADHTPGEPVVTQPTCTKDGVSITYCDVCGDELKRETIDKLEHTWGAYTDHWDYPCATGVRTYTCTNGGCDGINATKTEPLAAQTEHTPGTWTDTDQPGCCEQVFETNCTVCGTKMTKTSPAIRKHNYNSVSFGGFVCDYCGDMKSAGEWTDSALAVSAELGASALAASATDIIQEVLKGTQAEVNAAETREEVIDALAGLHQKLVDQLVEKVKVSVNGTEIGLTEGMAKSLLESLGVTSVLEDVQKEAGDSFLSKESLQVTVSKIVDTVVSEDGTAATKKSAHDALFTMLYSNSEELNPEYDSSVSGLILQLAQTAANEDTDWDALTKNLLNDLLNEALDEVRSDKVSSSIGNAVAEALKDALPGGLLKLWFSDVMGGVTTDVYRAYTSDEQFEELFNEVGDLVRAQIVEDPEFVNEVRKIIETAAAHAKEGVDKGWSEEKIYTNLRNDLNGVSSLVTSQIESLGTDAGDFAEGKVDSTVQKLLLSGKLGSWLGDKLGSATKDLVNDVIEKESKSIANTIDSYIKYYTCFDHDWQPVEVRSATCTSAAMTSDQCTKCGWRKSSKTEVGSPLGHEIVYDDPVEANEYAGGLTGGSHCSRCGAVLQAQQSIPRLMPTIYSDSEYHRGITEADATALGYASLEELNAALDAAVREAGFDPANSIRFTAQVNSSIGILPNDRFPSDGTEILLPFPSDPSKEYYAVQVFAADTVLHTTGELLTTRVKKYANSIGLDLYSQAIVIVAWN